MSRRTRASVRSFGGHTSVLPSFTIGSLVQQAPDAEIRHFIRRRRTSAVGYAE